MMTTVTSSGKPAPLVRRDGVGLRAAVSALCGAVVAMLGALVLVGWIADVPQMKSVLPGLATMKVNTALCFIAAGFAMARLSLVAPGRRWDTPAQAAALFVLIVTLLTLFQYASGVTLGIDELMFRETGTSAGSAVPGRMAAATAVALLCAAFALLLPQGAARHFGLRIVLWLIVATIASAGMVGYVTDSQALDRTFLYSSMAVHTALGLAVLAAGGIVQSWPARSLDALLTGGAVAEGADRYVFAFVLVALAAWLRYVLAEAVGLTPPHATFYLAVMLTALIVGLVPALFAIVLSVVVANIFFMYPFGMPSTQPGDLVALGLFVVNGLAISLLAGRWATLHREAAGSRDAMQGEVALRTEELRKSESFSRSVLESSPDCIKVINLSGVVEFMNGNGQKQMEVDDTGFRQGKMWTSLWPEETRPIVMASIENAKAGTASHFEAFCPTLKGNPKWWDVAVSPVLDSAGRCISIVSVSRDITERKRNEDRQTLLMHELNHRVKNTLATVQSMAHQTMRTSPDLDEARKRLESRLIALSKAHDVLTREKWESAPLSEIVANAIQPYIGEGAARFETGGPAIRVTPQFALTLAMVLHELCTNAAKYGALSNASGKVSLTWSEATEAGGAALHLQWIESGGPAVAVPSRKGFGSRLIERTLTGEFGGSVQITYAPTGLTCMIAAPRAREGQGRKAADAGGVTAMSGAALHAAS